MLITQQLIVPISDAGGQMSGSEINNAVTVSVTLGTTSGQGTYISPLTITAGGKIAPATPGATALSAAIAAGYVLNQGTVLGAKGSIGNAASVAGNGGTGIYLTAGSVTNHGSIAGGIGGYGAYQNLPGNGGTGVVVNGGTLTNNGTIEGGLEGYGGNQVAPVSVGTGVVLLNGSLTNNGTITGDVGVRITTGNMANVGTISGRSAGIGIVAGTVTNVGMIDSVGGVGVTLTGGMLINAGGVVGGVGSPGYFVPVSYPSYRMIPGGTGAAAIEISSGTVINDGTITGGIGGAGGTLDASGIPLVGEGGAGGYGISLVAGDLTNNGTIIGGAGGFGGTPGAGGVGVAFRAGGTLTDAGIINGGTGVGGTAAAVSFGIGASRLVLVPGATFNGAVVANASYSNVLELATGISAGTLSGGIGSEYQGFSTIAVDVGADWTLTATNTLDAGDFMMVYGSLTVDGSLINDGTITGGGSGQIGGGSAGVVLRTGSLTNHGTIVGSAGGFGTGPYGPFGGNGGTAVELTNGSLTNDGIITGGEGGYAVPTPGANGRGGTGVELEDGRFTNNGTILGGAAGGVDPNDGLGGVGVHLRNGGTLTDAGFIGGGAGNGGIAEAVVFGTGASRLILNPGASFDGAVHAYAAFSNVMELAIGSSAGTIASLGDTIAGFGTIQFDAGASWLIEGNAAGLAAGQTINGFALTDTIELTGFVQTDHSFTGNGLVLSGMSGSETIAIQGTFATSDFNVFSTATDTFVELAVPCFAAGTRLSTERGEIVVESLQVGDEVVVHPGDRAAAVIWIGHRFVDCRRHPDPRKVWPVCVLAGAFGLTPYRDLWLSPDHALFCRDVLIPVKYLINGTTIAQMPVDHVRYYHVQLREHSILLAEGLPAESYLDTGDRSNFANGEGPIVLYPDFASRVWEAQGCAPLVVTGPLLDVTRRLVSFISTQHDWLARVAQPPR